ncbi:hypothetical protein BCT30_18645 [Enterovibrio norvegicus]|uniref:Universal stress protein family protein n=2 Tax=Enterovibrio norvegicus TaxID=188144 RepID=A0A1I5LR22_9GAMM|nr:universal stress protein [Enterovibrio norvegicus]MCC4798544.1 universal stress protein [Enterovibrio norvegicus]OEE63155.1 hypothetical protein A1OS_17600 [Enterovibrio norvegicus]OEF48960.1 hypothetical protein A1OW_13870 [Enterovibrio norvegicus]OEF57058.1 hypothetical protein A1OU_20145 [Enterovibrio norvegicus]PMH65439.1 hypothetical protein BCU62_12655 [Enterovibrio norvegicus]
MTIRTIIMPFASHANAKQRISGALSVAQFFDAHLDVLHAQINPKQLLPEERQLISDEFYKRIDQIVADYVSEDAEPLKALFEDACQRLHISTQTRIPRYATSQPETTAMWQDVYGFRGEVVAEKGKLSDMTIIPQAKRGKSSVSFEAAILHSGKPVLIMPRTQDVFAPKHATIAWNGDTQAAKAVTAAMPLLRKVDTVTIATSERSVNNKPTQSELQDYLAMHGIQSESKVFGAGRLRAPQALLEQAAALNSDVIVCGAYSHQRIHQQMFGDFTKSLLKRSTIPLFMMS